MKKLLLIVLILIVIISIAGCGAKVDITKEDYLEWRAEAVSLVNDMKQLNWAIFNVYVYPATEEIIKGQYSGKDWQEEKQIRRSMMNDIKTQIDLFDIKYDKSYTLMKETTSISILYISMEYLFEDISDKSYVLETPEQYLEWAMGQEASYKRQVNSVNIMIKKLDEQFGYKEP